MIALIDLRRSRLRLLVIAVLVLLCDFATGKGNDVLVLKNNGAIRVGNPDRPLVALMVNVDWGEEFLPSMLEVLKSKNARVTFFVVGRWARKNPDLLRRMHAEGHEIASHGESHKLATRLSDAELDRLIAQGISTLRETLGVEPSPLFAPPSGDCDARVVSAAERHGCKTILWTLDTVDWKRPSAATIVERVVPRAVPGALILMHPTRPTLEALPEIIDGLRHKGLEPAVVTKVIEP